MIFILYCLIPFSISFNANPGIEIKAEECKGEERCSMLLVQSVTANNCSFNDLKLRTCDIYSSGGAIYIFRGGSIEIKNCTFKNCSVPYQGGAIYLCSLVSASIDFCCFESCETHNNESINACTPSGAHGAAIAFNKVNKIDLIESDFIDNEIYNGQNLDGGDSMCALYFENCQNCALKNLEFNDSISCSSEIGIHINDEKLSNPIFTIQHCCFKSDMKPFEIDIKVDLKLAFNLLEANSFKQYNFAESDKIKIYSDPIFTTDGGCRYASDSVPFSESDPYTQSIAFSLSHSFTQSDTYSDSEEFTQSSDFPDSYVFSNSKYFTFSIDFSETEYFSGSVNFTESNNFTQSSDFIQSSDFSLSTSFTPSQTGNLTSPNGGGGMPVSEKGTKLGTGGIIGIVVGCLALLAILILLLLLFLRRKRSAFIPPEEDPLNIDGFDIPINMYD